MSINRHFIASIMSIGCAVGLDDFCHYLALSLVEKPSHRKEVDRLDLNKAGQVWYAKTTKTERRHGTARRGWHMHTRAREAGG